MLRPEQPLAIYMEGELGGDAGKMGYGVLRYSPNSVACVIDSKHAGKRVGEVVDTPRSVPIVATIAEAVALGSEAVVLGIAPPGGRIPDRWLSALDEAVAAGLSIVNGLHDQLAPRYPTLQPGQWVWDLRREPEGLSPGTGAAMALPNRRLLLVGTDMAVGKMTAGLEIHRAALAAGIRSHFVATGQIGITICGSGVALDAVRVDYAAGAIEREVIRARDAELVIVEGQGSLGHPGSTATLPLMRGSMPTDLILCVRAGQTHLRRLPHIPIPPLPKVIATLESLATAGGVFPAAKVVSVAVNSSHMSAESAVASIEAIRRETGLPAIDPVRHGPAGLL